MLAVIVAALLQGTAPTAPPPRPEQITSPDWLRRPTGADVGRVYPSSAERKNLPGRATLQCGVTAKGLLSNCTVIEESPAGEGFGQAALQLVPEFEMRPMTRGGQPVGGGTVRIPLRFMISDRTDPLSALLGCYGQTAAAAEKDPEDAEFLRAYGFFAAQVALLQVQGKASPEAFETGLRAARVSALQSGPLSPTGPDLKVCLTLVQKQQAR